LKNLWPKSQNVLTIAIFIFIGNSNCSEGNIFFAKKCGFAKEASFYPKTTISAINLKLSELTSLQLVFIYLNKTYNHISNTIVDTYFNSDPFLS